MVARSPVYVGSWYLQSGSDVYYVANLASCYHAFFAAGIVEILVLTRICLRFGGCLYVHGVVLLKECLAADMLL